MQGTQYATKRSILCRGAFCGPTMHTLKQNAIEVQKTVQLFKYDKKNRAKHKTRPRSVFN